ncbi:MAG: carbohydrate ABC transporter permease [Spirochaetota bacterium]
MSDTTLPRPQMSLGGALVMVTVGVFLSVVLGFVLAFLTTILSTAEFRMPYLWLAVSGLVLGPAVSLTRFRGRTSPLLSAGIGLAIGLIWIAVTGLSPFGMDGPSLVGIVGPPAIFALAGFMTRKALREVNLEHITRDARDKLLVRMLRAIGIVFYLAIVAVPFYFMLASSLKSRAAIVSDPTDLSINFAQPIGDLLVGYSEVITRFSFGRYIFNSTFVAIATVILTLIPAILGAYAVTRLHFPGRKFFSRSILLIYMFPAIVLVIPLYSIFSQLGLRDTLPGLLIVYPAMTIPVGLYMLRSYFQTLPRDVEDQGLVDGLTRFQVITKIVLPLSAPALASVGLYVFMIAWNEFLFAFMFLDSPEIFTLSRGMVALNSQEVPRQFLMAGALIITVPIMVLFFWFEKYLVGGLTAGGVKG